MRNCLWEGGKEGGREESISYVEKGVRMRVGVKKMLPMTGGVETGI